MKLTCGGPEAADAPSDQDLMRAITGREHAALVCLHDRYRGLLSRLVNRLVIDVSDVEEIVQDVFTTVWNRAESFDAGRGEPLGWVICVARRRAIDHLRRNHHHACIVRLDRLIEGDLSLGNGPALEGIPRSDEPAVARDLYRHLATLIGELPAEQQRVLHLTYFGDLSQRQIVAHTGIPLGTVKTRLALAHRNLLHKARHLREDWM